MVEVTSALLGGGVLSAGAGVLYSAYQYGHRRARAPESVVDTNEVFNYLSKKQAIDSLDDEVDKGGE